MVFLFQRIVTHYRSPVYKRLNEALKGGFVVSYGQQVKNGFFSTPEDFLPFKTVRVKNFWFKGETAVWQNFWKPFQMFGRPEAVIMEHSPRILFLFPLYLYCKLQKIPFILWGHGGSRKRSVSKSPAVKDIIHRWMIRKADAYITYTEGIKQELVKVTDQKKLFVACNTLDTEAIFFVRSELEREGKESVKRRLGLIQNHYICFVSRLLLDKQTDYLIDVYEIVKMKYPDTGVIIIGDGPERSFLEGYAANKNLKDVVFTGGIPDWEKSGAYLFASDVMVMPAYVGLSVNHVFCFGLPVITQEAGKNGPFHGPEVEYIEDGKTGFICKNNDKHEMADKTINVFENQPYFKEQTIRFCETNLSIENMASGVKEAVDYVMERKKGSTE